MSTAVVLTIYSALLLVASLAGGWIPILVRLTHRRMQIAISFVAGVMLGIGLLHLLPHGYFALGSINAVVAWVMVGFMVMFFLERFFHFHQHTVPGEPAEALEHDHDAQHHRGHEHLGHAPSNSFTWAGAAVGLTLHSLIDGVALAAGVAAEPAGGHVIWAGLGTFLAIFLHKPFDSLTIGTLMAASGWSTAWRHVINLAYALVMPCGVLLFYFGADYLAHDYELYVGRALGFSAGVFLCIATSDLLPELQFHSHDRTKLSLALVLGVALAYSIVYVESSGHGPTGHEHESPREHDHHEH